MTFHELADTLEQVARQRGKMTRLEYAAFLENVSSRLYDEAQKLRQSASPPEQSVGGFGDQVKAQVFGPDGVLKQEIERN